MPKQEQRFEYANTKVLENARRDAGLTTKAAADYFFVIPDTFRAWELGTSSPHEHYVAESADGVRLQPRRLRFLRYLLDRLGLRRTPEVVEAIWRDVMVDQWEWEPLSDEEQWNYLPGRKVLLTQSAVRPFLAPPLPSLDIVGRDSLLEKIERLLLDNKRVALHGKPGVGKSALAIAIAHDRNILEQFNGGVLWASLGQTPNVLNELRRFGMSLGIPADKIRQLKEDMEAMREEIQFRIGLKHFLLVMDDAWDWAVLGNFIMGGANCAYLVTTRLSKVAHRFAQSNAEEVLELDPDASYQLLANCAPIAVKRQQDAVRQLASAVDGLPLGLVLMGKYLGEESVTNQSRLIDAAVDRLRNVDARFGLAEERSPDQPSPSLRPDQKISLQSIIAVSEEALDLDARHALRALSVLPPKPKSFTEQLAVAVSASSLYAIDSLVRYALLETIGENRYTMHQTIADYGQLNSTDDFAYFRFVQYIVKYVQDNERDFGMLDLEYDNIMEALRIAQAQNLWLPLAQATNAFAQYLEARGLYTRAVELLQQAEKAARFLDERQTLMMTLRHLGRLAVHQGEYERAKSLWEEGLTLANERKDDKEVAAFLQNLGVIEDNLGNESGAKDFYHRALTVASACGDDHRVVGLLQNLAIVEDNQGNFDEADRLYRAALDMARQQGDTDRITKLLANLAGLAHDRGMFSEAEIFLNEAVPLARELGNQNSLCALLTNQGAIAGERGDFVAEREYYEEALEIARKLMHPERICFLLANLGALARQEGDSNKAEEYLNEGLPLARQIKHHERICSMLEQLAYLELDQNHLTQAEAYIEEGILLARDSKHIKRLAGILVALGELKLIQHRLEDSQMAYVEALSTIPEGNIPEVVAAARFGLAKVANAKRDSKEARQQAKVSLEIYSSIRHYRVQEVEQWLGFLGSEDD